MPRISSTIACAILAGLLLSAPRAQAGPYVLADLDTGRVIDESESTRPWYPASLTKMMTAFVVLEAVRTGRVTLDTPIIYTARAQAEPPAKMGLPVGQVVTVDNALKMMLVKSANDIAVMLAEGVGGSVEGFAEEMNATARRLGMANTHYVNPNGLHNPGQVSSARDIALLARAIMVEHPDYARYFGIQSLRLGKRTIRGYNMLLGRYPGTTGMKTGFICPSGFNLVGTARRGSSQLVAVVLGAYSARERAEMAAGLLEKGFQPTSWLASIGPRGGPMLTQLPASGYAEPTDMREDICSPAGRRKRMAAASESEGADAVVEPKAVKGKKGTKKKAARKGSEARIVETGSDAASDTDKAPEAGVVALAAAMKAEPPSLLSKTVTLFPPEPIFLGPNPANPTTPMPTLPVYAAAPGAPSSTGISGRSAAESAGALALAPTPAGVAAQVPALAVVGQGRLRSTPQPIGRIPLPRPKPAE